MSNEWFEKGELPPVESECVVDSKACEAKFVRIFHGKTVNILMHMTDHTGARLAVFSMPDPSDKTCLCFHGMIAGSFHPIKSDREKAIEAAADKIRYATIKSLTRDDVADIASSLYDAGLLRLPEDK